MAKLKETAAGDGTNFNQLGRSAVCSRGYHSGTINCSPGEKIPLQSFERGACFVKAL